MVAYASKGLRYNGTRYPTHKLGVLAPKRVVVEKEMGYLYGNLFQVHTNYLRLLSLLPLNSTLLHTDSYLVQFYF